MGRDGKLESTENDRNIIYLYVWFIIVTFVYYLYQGMLSKMMKDQPKLSNSIAIQKNNNKTEICKKKSNQSDEQLLANEQIKPNLKSTSGAHGTSITNWEKFKDIIKDSASSEDKKHKGKPSPTAKPLTRHKRNFNNVGSPASVYSSVRTTIKEAKEDKTMAKKRNLLTKQVAIDCEMVGIGDGTDSMLARVSLVNRYGDCIYDKYVKPREKILDYRTAVSGIRPHHLHNGEDFQTVQKEVAEILHGRILVGHALKHDTDVLFLSHPRRMIRDTSRYKQFRKVSKGNTPSLKKLAVELLGINIQSGEHNSVEDARTAMQLYTLYKNQWEADLRTKR